MKAVIVRAPGGVDQLVYGDVPDPVIGVDDVLVRVRAAAVNHADVWLRQGAPGLGPLPLIPGIDVAGEVVAVGAAVREVHRDQRVVVNPAVTCDRCRFCLGGRHGLCPRRRALGQQLPGGYAELVRVPAVNVHELDDAVGFEEGAAVPAAFLTAWQSVVTRAQVGPEESVLVVAAAGGVGSAAVQVASLRGARVIAAVGSPAKLAPVVSFGADVAVDYGRDDLGAAVLEATGGQGVDVVIDTVGAPMWPHYMRCTASGGRIVVNGFTGGQEIPFDAPQVQYRSLTILGSGPLGAKGEAAAVVRLLNDGRIRGVVDRVLPLAQAAQAHELLEGRSVVGKLVLRPG